MRATINVGVLIAAIALAVSGCASGSGGDEGGAGSAPVDVRSRPPATKAGSIAGVNAACSAYYRYEPVDPGVDAPVDQLRSYAAARVKALDVGLDQVASVNFIPRDRHFAELVHNNFTSARSIYRQVLSPAGPRSQPEVEALMGSARRLVIETAAELIVFGATKCAPTVQAPPAPAGSGAAPLAARSPSAVIAVGTPLLDNKAIVVDSGGVWVALGREPSVVRIDPATNKVVARVRMPSPITQQIQAIDGHVWVPTQSELVRIDERRNRIDWRMGLAQLAPPDSAFTVVGRTLWACNRNVLLRVDVKTRRRAPDIQLPGGCQALVGDERNVIVGYGAPDRHLNPGFGVPGALIARVDARTGAVQHDDLALVSSVWGMTSAGPGRVVLDEDGTIAEIDVPRGRVLRSIPRGGTPGNQLALAGDTVWTTRPDEQRIVGYDLASGALTELRGGPGVVGVAYARGSLSATNSDAGTVMRYRVGS